MQSSSRLFKILGISVLVIAAGITLWFSQDIDVTLLKNRLESFGPLAWLVFMLVYALGTIMFFPGSILTLAGGAMFGPVLGTFLNLTGATIGAGLAFLISRYLASGWVEKKATGRLKELKNGVEEEGWRFVAFVRLVPVFPFFLLNYALGLTKIRFSHYLVASYICMLPGAVAYTYLGYVGREAVAGGEGLVEKILIGLALLASAAFLPRIIKRFKNNEYKKSPLE